MASRSSLAALVAAVLLVPSLVAQPTVQVAARAGGGSVLLVDDNGTPVVVRPSDGAVLEGYRPAETLRAFLTASPSPASKDIK